MNRLRFYLTLAVLIAVLVSISSLCGCQEPQRWGNGELPPEWDESFGGNNISRLNYLQSRRQDRMWLLLHGANITDANGVASHIPGVIEKLNAFEKLNSQQHKKLGKTDITLCNRVEALEKVGEDGESE